MNARIQTPFVVVVVVAVAVAVAEAEAVAVAVAAPVPAPVPIPAVLVAVRRRVSWRARVRSNAERSKCFLHPLRWVPLLVASTSKPCGACP